MSDQLNFKQIPFDTMYYNNLSKKGGQVLIECDPNRTVLKIIESCITKNNTVLSDAELAQWILRYHIQRTKNHVENVKLCANYLREFFQFGGYFDRFIAKVQQHDYDKLQGNEHVASFALNAPLYKYKDLYEISPEAKRIYEEIEWPKHHMLNDHHPENYMHRPDPEKKQWVISDEELEDVYKDKGGHPAIMMALGEMVADWAAVGIEMGDTAKDWWLKNKDKRWSYGPRYTQVLEACLMWIPSKLYVQSSEPIPDPPKLKVSATSQVGEETTSTEAIVISSEGLFDPVVEEGMYYTIRNFPVIQFFNKLRKEYKTTKLEHLFKVIGIRFFFAQKRTISIHKFFIPELLYLLDKFQFPVSLMDMIKSHTWVGDVVQPTEFADLTVLNKEINAKFYEHQIEFIKNYVSNKTMNHLRGYLLSFEQGLGKTITALGLMTALKKEHVVIICPKNTMLETWNTHLIKFFNQKQKVWIAGYTKGPLTTSSRWIIVNYERIEEVKEFLIKNKLNNLGVIVDESHNFLRTSSLRTQLLLDLARYNQNADLLLLSGTPIKCAGVELIPIMSVLDPYFDEEACTIFKATFGFNTAIANDVLNARLTRMITRVTKDILSLPEKKETTVSVHMPTGWKYTVSQVEKQIITFVKERQDYYQQNLTTYITAFEEAIKWLQNEPGIGDQPEFQRYMDIIDELKNSNIVDARGNADIVWANKYEHDVLIPALPDDFKKKFIWSKSVVKYLPLKIKGEVIGTLLTHLRMQMTTEMMQAADLKQYVDNAMKKTVVFTSYVDTIELARDYFQEEGYSPLAVYGKTASELTNIVKRFQEDQSLNPLIASLKMLSTGATLTAANTVIFLNKPWRSIEYQQASDRVHRIGQDTECEIISLVLDTGKEANLSTRMEDIMQWSSDQFDQIVDQKERELMRKFFKSFASLEIPEDCVVSEEKAASPQAGEVEVVDVKGKPVYVGIPEGTVEPPMRGNRALVCKEKNDAVAFGARSATWKEKRETVLFKVTPKQVDLHNSLIVIEYNDLKDPKWRYRGKANQTVSVDLYTIPTNRCTQEFLVESISRKKILRYTGDPSHVSIVGLQPLTYTNIDVQYVHNPKLDGKNEPESESPESLGLSKSSITLRELNPSNHAEIKYVMDTADLINDDPDDYKKWTPDDVKKDLQNGRQFFLLMRESEVIGSIGVMFYDDNTVDLFNLGIFPKYQGKGYGKQSVYATIQYVLEHNPNTTEIYICAYKTNQKVCHLYESMGFKIVETREKMYLMVLKVNGSMESNADNSRLRLYHLSYGQSVASKMLTPRIPDNEFVEWGVEDGTTKRICFATSISKATLALGRCKEGQELHVYEVDLSSVDQAILMKHIVTPSKDQVPDVDITKEVWCTIPVKVKYTKTIKLTSIKHEYTLKFKRKDGTEYVGHPREWNYDVVSVVDPRSESQPSTEQLGSSMEASTIPSKIAQKKKKILDFICKLCDTMEPSGLNSKRYRQIIGQMNDKEFDQFMNYMKEGKWQLHLVAPNMIVNLQNEDLLKACDLIGLDLFQRVWMYDRATGRKYLTDNKYMFVKLPIRRQQQFLDEKISVPDNDRTIDGLTGQVTGDSRSCSITNPEIQILAARGLDKTMQELVNIRGGNIHGYSEFRRMLEENGEADLDMIDPNSRTRASVVGSKLLQSMMLDTNL